jgi:hypothetical protein
MYTIPDMGEEFRGGHNLENIGQHVRTLQEQAYFPGEPTRATLQTALQLEDVRNFRLFAISERDQKYVNPRHFAALPDDQPVLTKVLVDYGKNIASYEREAIAHLGMPIRLFKELTMMDIKSIDVLEMLSSDPEAWCGPGPLCDAVVEASEYLKEWREKFSGESH